MREISVKDIRLEIYSGHQLRRIRRLLPVFLGVALLLAVSFGCGPPSSRGDGGQSSSSDGTPELTDDTIRERINDTGIWDVPEENGAGGPIPWNFDENEPKEIAVVDKHVDGSRATIVLDIKTRSAPRSRTQLYLAGQIRTEWKLETGWVLRRWQIVRTENISMKYKSLSPPPGQNSNTQPAASETPGTRP